MNIVPAIRAVCAGQTVFGNEITSKISENLFLSEGTVRNYISEILEKLELRDRMQIAVFYYKHRSGTYDLSIN